MYIHFSPFNPVNVAIMVADVGRLLSFLPYTASQFSLFSLVVARISFFHSDKLRRDNLTTFCASVRMCVTDLGFHEGEVTGVCVSVEKTLFAA